MQTQPHHAAAPTWTRDAYVARLKAENAELIAQNAALEMALYGADRGAINFPVRPQWRTLLDLLMRHTTVSNEQIVMALEAQAPTQICRPRDAVHCLMSHVRSFLRPHGVTIHFMRGRGYWIVPADKLRLRELFCA